MLRVLVLVTFAAWASPVHAADDAASAIATLRAVGSKGEGSKAAVAASKVAAALPVERLPMLLAGLDGANPIAANYLRGAIDAIAERRLDSGGRLPAEALEKFVLDSSHDGRARRLAYELLGRVDPSVEQRLMPKMLNDPSLELRRDAVALRIAAGKAKQDAGEVAAAKTMFAEAFAASRELDQVRDLAERLKKLDQRVDLPKHFGFIMTWRLIGPFDNTKQSAFDKAYPPEQKIDLAATYRGKLGEVAWKSYTTTDEYGVVDLTKALDKHKGAVVYATAEVESAAARECDVRIGCINANKVWLNGKYLGGRDVYHTGMEVDQYVYRGQLQAGKNVVLVKVLQNEQSDDWAQNWMFQLRICDRVGTPVVGEK
jgi:hypothetical protein